LWVLFKPAGFLSPGYNVKTVSSVADAMGWWISSRDVCTREMLQHLKCKRQHFCNTEPLKSITVIKILKVSDSPS
jgi:hypothetical protein